MTPDEYTLSEQYLYVSGGHQLFVYESGQPKGQKADCIFAWWAGRSKIATRTILTQRNSA